MQVAAFFQYLLTAIAGVFVIVNPLTTAFVFVSLRPHAELAERKFIAKRATTVATIVFFSFALLGSAIFQLFGITFEAFRIAGGLILFGIAMTMLGRRNNAPHQPAAPAAPTGPEGTRTLETEARTADDISIIPLAIPFISGPGAIATVMLLAREAPTIYHTGILFLAVLLCTVTCYFAIVHSEYVVRYLGQSGREIVSKLFGLILAVIAVQFVINGVTEVAGGFFADLPIPLTEPPTPK